MGVAQHTALHRPARLLQQGAGLQQIGPQAARRVGVGRHGHGAQGARRQVVGVGGQQLLLGGRGQASGFTGGVAKNAIHPLVRAIEHLAVHPLVIQRQPQRLAHAHVLQVRLAGVEHIALKAGGQLVGKFALDQFAGVELLAIHAPRPIAGAEKAHDIKFARFQGFELGGVVFVDVDFHPVKVERAHAHRQVFGPVVGIAHVGDVFAKAHRANAVGAAANGRFHHHLVKRFARAPGAAENGQAAHGQRQFAIGRFKAKAHRAGIQHIHPGHVDEQGFVTRRGVRPHQGVKTVLYILGQHRLTVVKTRLWAQPEGGREAISGHADILGQQAIAGGRFVHAARQQAVKQQLRQIRRGAAFDGEGVVFVKRGRAAIAHQAQCAALGGLGMHIVEMRKICRVFGAAPQGVGRLGPRRAAEQGTGQRHEANYFQRYVHATILPHAGSASSLSLYDL